METNCLLVTRIFLIRRVYVNVRENRRGNQEWIIRDTGNIGYTRHRRHKTQDQDKQNKKHNAENYKDEQHRSH
jgi:hypothetical protein